MLLHNSETSTLLPQDMQQFYNV